jgi:hypothetical protein
MATDPPEGENEGRRAAEERRKRGIGLGEEGTGGVMLPHRTGRREDRREEKRGEESRRRERDTSEEDRPGKERPE